MGLSSALKAEVESILSGDVCMLPVPQQDPEA